MTNETRTFGDVTVVRLTSKQDAETWAKEQDEFTYDYLKVHGDLEPGWYVPSVEREPCPHGCCHDYNMYLEHVDAWLGSQRPLLDAIREIDKIARKDRTVRDVQCS